jgi:hypothetical protein
MHDSYLSSSSSSFGSPDWRMGDSSEDEGTLVSSPVSKLSSPPLLVLGGPAPLRLPWKEAFPMLSDLVWDCLHFAASLTRVVCSQPARWGVRKMATWQGY